VHQGEIDLLLTCLASAKICAICGWILILHRLVDEKVPGSG
jgi:hypothetical protein